MPLITRSPVLTPAGTRCAWLIEAPAHTHDSATAPPDGLFHAGALYGLERLAGRDPVFVRLNTLPADPAWIEGWKDTRATLLVPDHLAANDPDHIQVLVSAGHRIASLCTSEAIGDYRAAWLALDLDAAQTPCPTALAARRRPDQRLLALGLRKEHDRAACETSGFDLLHGPLTLAPRHAGPGVMAADRSALLGLLATLRDPDCDVREIEGIVMRDATLSAKLFRLLRSAYFGMPRTFDTLRGAVTFFGLTRLRQWTSMLLLTSVDYRPREILSQVVVRACWLAGLARATGAADPEIAWTTGLFSRLDALLGQTHAQAVEQLGLPDVIAQAIIERAGPLGQLLATVEGHETGRWIPPAGMELPVPVAMHHWLVALDEARAFEQACDAAAGGTAGRQ